MDCTLTNADAQQMIAESIRNATFIGSVYGGVAVAIIIGVIWWIETRK